MCRDSLAHYLSNSTGLSFNNTLKFLDNITAEAQDAADIDAEMVLRADRALETIRFSIRLQAAEHSYAVCWMK